MDTPEQRPWGRFANMVSNCLDRRAGYRGMSPAQ